jgi:hypothetical protein
MLSIIRLLQQEKPRVDPRELYIAAMYLMFLRAPGLKTAPGEPVDLGEIGSTREPQFSRVTPYSPAQRVEQ